ncbi:hypothetical protein BpHYR1_032649 [Brachionus plicatilis]|uniref:Uncharacterized protein n=1 Tax=Brachionus plicatilis TaxID=10195 RepID=A0A3M7PX23_BRAPC|nr:hypothetical protein BpHYR1_032649 [Brachionus plicatilis]
MNEIIRNHRDRGRGVRVETKNVKPLFEIDLWNLTYRIKDCLPNNFAEAWHNAFSRYFFYFNFFFQETPTMTIYN